MKKLIALIAATVAIAIAVNTPVAIAALQASSRASGF